MFESIDRVVTRGELEAAISDLIVKFELEYFGRGPQQIRTHLIGDMLLVRMSGVLTPSELRLVRGANSAAATVLLKRMRTQLIETATPLIQLIVKKVTQVNVVSMMYDLGLATDEEIILLTLSNAPDCCETSMS
ncbi:DUF2294 domain-containing protein [Schlesneria sp. DSM 10557]|uniref:DUF2294 domain-containing protein n=2 Tax=unclassified Schlesneria TaxID=2762017 RepID=UPI00359FFEC3